MLSWALIPRAQSDTFPTYELPATVAGIRPASPGFTAVEVAPNLGRLRRLEVRVPHPRGSVDLSVRSDGAGGISGTVSVPAETSGRLVWNGEVRDLLAGTTTEL